MGSNDNLVRMETEQSVQGMRDGDPHDAVYIPDESAPHVSTADGVTEIVMQDESGDDLQTPVKVAPTVTTISSESEADSDCDVFNRCRPRVSISQMRTTPPAQNAASSCEGNTTNNVVKNIESHQQSVDLYINSTHDEGVVDMVNDMKTPTASTDTQLDSPALSISSQLPPQTSVDNSTKQPCGAAVTAFTDADREFFETFALSSSEDEADEIPLLPVDQKKLPDSVSDKNAPAESSQTTEEEYQSAEPSIPAAQDTIVEKSSAGPTASGFKHWSFIQKDPDITGIPASPDIQPVTSTQRTSVAPPESPVDQRDGSSENDVVMLGSSVCNLYNSKSVCQTSTPVRQTQLTRFCKPVENVSEDADNPSERNNNKAEKWARGQIMEDHEVCQFVLFTVVSDLWCTK